MTYRERREARAEQLREWAAKREAAANATLKANEVHTGDHAFNFQPGHIPERARVIARTDRAFESLDKAREMTGRAAGIEAQADRAIYSDDADAAERLEARIAELEQQRETMKARNAAYRKEHAGELRAMSAYERGQAVPHPSWELQNLGGNISRLRKRLVEVRAAAARPASDRGPVRWMAARFSSDCAECGATIAKGSRIGYYRAAREALCEPCATSAEQPQAPADDPQEPAELVRVLGADAAYAVGRFEVDGPHGYRAKSGGPLRATRAEAEADERAELESRTA